MITSSRELNNQTEYILPNGIYFYLITDENNELIEVLHSDLIHNQAMTYSKCNWKSLKGFIHKLQDYKYFNSSFPYKHNVQLK